MSPIVGTRHIRSRWFDLVFFSLGWLPVFGALFVAHEMSQGPGGDLSALVSAGRMSERALILFVLVVNFAHRHITFPLVYGDREVFEARRGRYVWLPIVFAVVTLGAALWVVPANVTGTPAVVDVDGRVNEPLRVVFYLPTDPKVDGVTKRRIATVAAGKTLIEIAKTLDATVGAEVEIGVDATGSRLVFSQPIGLFQTKARAYFLVRGNQRTTRTLGLPPGRHQAKQPLLALLLALSVGWTIYHTLMQKMGILRMYSRVAEAGSAKLDRAFVFVWFFTVVASIASREDIRETAAKASSVGRMVRPAFDAMAPALAIAQWVLLAASVVVTVAWVRRERTDRGRLHLTRTFFALSLLVLYATLSYDLVVGFATLAVSHSIEYIAFVGVFTSKKYARIEPERSSWIGRRAQRPLQAVAGFVVFTTILFVLARTSAPVWLDAYIVGSSFLHFLYDGWLWKVRKPEVSAPIAGDESSSDRAPG